jgi:uncharacterized protein YyaL (SSP411 family)
MNRLSEETSPYLLQHASNPVHWYPWGDAALSKSRELERPIFLSIGYSACHWCHVMAHESFEDDGIAAILNAAFVSIKVDREERPDLDEIYMRAVQAMTGQGGWPMTVFLTPDLEPFFGGTYFPPEDAHARPGFASLLAWITRLWNTDRERAVEQARSLTRMIRDESRVKTEAEIDAGVLDLSLGALSNQFDPRWGGFGQAPKFPHATDLRVLLRHWKRTKNPQALEMVETTLRRMAAGGIYDHLGGGFARYSTDEKWLIPHFEKMLYDNALLIPAYLEAYLITGDEAHAETVRETCAWVLREMVRPEGGFASTLDADSEGEEGKFYAWSPEELRQVLGDERGRWAAAWFGVTAAGNFEHGKSALWRPDPAAEVAERLEIDLAVLEPAMREARTALFQARAERIHPGKDDKVLAAWNGLMISALAQAHQVLGEESYLDAARNAARYVLTGMRRPDGRLFATARNGKAHLNAYLDDHAFLIQGLLDLYESDFDAGWIESALELNEILSGRFEDKERGGYFTTADDHEQLIARMKNPQDGALPSGNAVQAGNLLRLAELTGNPEHEKRAERCIRSPGQLVNRHPQAFSQLLLAVDMQVVGAREIVLAGEPGSPAFEELLRVVRSTYLPQRVVAHGHAGADTELMPVLAGKTASPGEARAFVCRNQTCGLPATSTDQLRDQLAC